MSTTSGSDVLTVRFSRHDQTVVLHLAGDLDVATAPVLRQALAGIIEDQGNLAVRLDLQEITFVDSTGLSVLIEALRRLREKGGHLTLANLRPQTRKVFDIVGLSTIFDIRPEPISAVAGVRLPTAPAMGKAVSLPPSGSAG